MSFSPILPLSGTAGWALLKRTLPAQTAALTSTPDMARDIDYFSAKIGNVTSADQLVADRRLLKVALGAFGLEADIGNKAFIKKVLSDGPIAPAALANRLADKRYLQLANAFRFDQSAPATQTPNFAATLLTAYKARMFETAVGAQDEDLHLALNTQRELASLGSARATETTKWLTVLGNAPLARVFQKALGLPSGTSSLNLDQQLGLYQSKASAIFGDSGISQFADPAKAEVVIKRFLSRSQADQLMTQSASGSAALTLLQQSPLSL